MSVRRIAVGVCALMSLLAGGVGRAAAPAPAPYLVRIGAEPAINRITLGGVVIPYKTVRAEALAGGRVDYVVGDAGTLVHGGQVLVAIDDTRELAGLMEAQAGFSTAQSAWRSAYAAYTRQLYSPRMNSVSGPQSMGPLGLFNMFFTRPFSSMVGIESPGLEYWAGTVGSYSALVAGAEKVRAARARIASAENALANTRTYAPFDSVVIAKDVEIGDTVQPGQPLMTVAYIARMRVKVEVPEHLVSGLSLGQTLPVTVGRGRLAMQGVVSEVYPLANPATHTVTVKLDLPRGAPVASGMYASISLPESGPLGAPQVVIPEAALVAGHYLPAVLVVPPGKERSELRLLRLGERLPGGAVVVLAGLRPGERIIVNPPPRAAGGWMPRAAGGGHQELKEKAKPKEVRAGTAGRVADDD